MGDACRRHVSPRGHRCAEIDHLHERVALSDASGELKIHVPHEAAGTSTLLPDSATHYPRVLDVQVTTLDLYCAQHNIAHIHFMKIDTEGNDLRVLRGAKEMLRAERIDVAQFEYNHAWINARAYLRDAFELVDGTPYRVARVCATGLEVYVAWHQELERFIDTNYALVHERVMARLNCAVLRIGDGNVARAVSR